MAWRRSSVRARLAPLATPFRRSRLRSRGPAAEPVRLSPRGEAAAWTQLGVSRAHPWAVARWNARETLASFAKRKPARAHQCLSTPSRLRPCLQNQVERRLGRAPHATESALFEHLRQTRLAGLRPQREADLLGERRRRANHGRGAIEDPPDWVEVFLDAVVGERLHNHPCAVRV